LHGYSCELRIANPKARDLDFAFRRAARCYQNRASNTSELDAKPMK